MIWGCNYGWHQQFAADQINPKLILVTNLLSFLWKINFLNCKIVSVSMRVVHNRSRFMALIVNGQRADSSSHFSTRGYAMNRLKFSCHFKMIQLFSLQR